MKPGKLWIVATPIGDPRDITLRAIEVLQTADAIICEETRRGSTLLKKLGITAKSLLTLNDHNEETSTLEILTHLSQGQNLALVSDCGTPVFADPGYNLVRQVAQAGIPIVPIPGPSSLMAAISVLDFKVERFVFAGFLPRQPDQRRSELLRLRALQMPVILMDTPYRMTTLLDEVLRVFGKGQNVTLACDLTLPGETILRGDIAYILQRIGKRKAEFVLVIH